METKIPTARIIRNLFFVVLFIAVLGASMRATEVDFPRMFRDMHKGGPILQEFLSPDVVTRAVTTVAIETTFPIPCGSAPEVNPAASGPRLVPSLKCADLRTKFTLEGFDLAPNSEVVVRWRFPNDTVMTAKRVQTDAKGHFIADLEARPIAVTVGGVPSKLQVDTNTPVGKWLPSQALKDVTQNMFITIFMALLSTTVATIVAAPLSFLAASNITRRGWLGTTVYSITRTFFNITRSYDPLVMATVFGFWLGFGPLPGVLSLTVVTIASLGKLFSEAVEGIDTGPIEALQATGANRLQTIVYAVIPQIVPDFVSFIIYHWDINVRISTIIGFVGGGGIGYYLSQRINSFEYSKAGTAIWAIVIVVWGMDFLSAEVRKRLT
jgi:phosphonate transport system permease protein